MLDKIWCDWQNRDPMNFNSFYGGSVEYLYSLAAYNEYPNGGPPYLNVSTRVLAYLEIEEFMLICLHSWIQPCRLTGYSQKSPSQTWWVQPAASCAINMSRVCTDLSLINLDYPNCTVKQGTLWSGSSPFSIRFLSLLISTGPLSRSGDFGLYLGVGNKTVDWGKLLSIKDMVCYICGRISESMEWWFHSL
jgi:hypothetical protein